MNLFSPFRNRLSFPKHLRLLDSLRERFSPRFGRVIRGKFLWTILLSLSLIGFPLISHALTVQDVPKPQQSGVWVSDMANILSENTKTQLNHIISELEATTGAEIAVVTVTTTAPSPTPKDFTIELFNEWKIGKSEVDNGVLFLTSVGDRRVEIETGYGVEDRLPDAKVGQIITTQITPKLQGGDWDGGILAGTIALVNEISGNTPVMEASESSSPSLLLGITSLIAFVFSFYGYQKVKSRTTQPLSLEPQGRSLVIGEFDNRLQPSVSGWIYGAVFSLCLALILLTLIPASSGILWQGFGRVSLPFFSFLESSGLSLVFWVLVSILFSYVVSPRIIAQFRAKVPVNCRKCQTPLLEINPESLSDRFTPPQQVAKRLGSTKFEGWHCSRCYPDDSTHFHLRRYLLNPDRFSECPHCQEFTMIVIEQKTIKKATYERGGILQIIYECQSCHDRDDTQQKIPRLTRDSSSSYGGGYGGNYGGGGGFGGGGGSSGSGGGFGGGSSGGGGAGGDF